MRVLAFASVEARDEALAQFEIREGTVARIGIDLGHLIFTEYVAGIGWQIPAPYERP